MVQSGAVTVDEFIAGVGDDRGPALRLLRNICREQLPGWEERMQWGMPGYGPPGGDVEVSFNSQKNYISIYPGCGALEAHRGKIENASFGGGCIRFPKPDKIDFEAIAVMLQHIRQHGRG